MRNKVQQIEGIHYRTGKTISISINNGVIISIQQIKSNKPLPMIAPGLIDLQINGHGGHDLNTLPLEDHVLSQLTRLLWKEGVTTYLPTIITNDGILIENAMRTISKVCSSNKKTNASIAGIHLEGPFISPEDGARGAHERKFIMEPDWYLFQKWQEAAEGRIKVITLSPEWPNTNQFISKCVESGVRVSIGHTSATPKQIQEAVSAGASMSTHLGNGSHSMLPRHQNYLWEQLNQDELWACIIADGFHLPASMLKAFLRMKGERSMLVSDAVYLSGMPAGNYSTHIGGDVVLTSEGKLHIKADPEILAGSAQMLRAGIEHLVHRNLATLADAWDMSSKRPANFMGLKTNKGLKVSSVADLVLFNWDQRNIEILQTYKNGKLVYES